MYESVEKALSHCADWRAWGKGSVLTQLLIWDGRKPDRELDLDNHFKTEDEAIQSGRLSVELLKEAITIIDAVKKKIKNELATAKTCHNDEQYCKTLVKYLFRIGEDKRSLLYALHTMKLMADLVAYHSALLHEKDDVERLWRDIEETSETMDCYYVPISYENPAPGIESKDALTRTQLRDVILRCTIARTAEPVNCP